MKVMSKIFGYLGLAEEEEVIEREVIEETTPFTKYSQQEQSKTRGNLVGLPGQKQVKMILSEPRSYDEAQEIADHLRSRRSVVISLQRIRPDQAVRIVDFLSGTVYALNGTISKVGANIFVCTPDTVEVQGAITDMLETDGDLNRTR